MKKMVAAVLILLTLQCMVTASASTGSAENPLISLSYLDGVFAVSLRAEINQTLGGAADRAIGRLDEIYRNYIGYSFAARYTRISLTADGTVALSSGASFILLSGTASLTVTSGEVVNVSNGNVVASGSRLMRNHRYFCTENTTAIVTATAASVGQVDGYYLLDGAGITVPTYVFVDVSQNDWFFTAVDFVYQNGLFTGTSANTFSPGTSMTRGMFVTVLHRLDELPEAGPGGGFTDVSNPSAYYYNAVTWANANNIVAGYTDGTFRPDRAVTREEMAAIMHRYAEYKRRDMSTPGNVFDTFPDRSDVSSYAVAPMRWAVSWEIIRGSGGMLLPRNTATRAEVAQIIFNYCEKIG